MGMILLFVGMGMFIGAMSANGWDFKKLSTIKYEVKTYEVDGEFSSIVLDSETSDINFILSIDGKNKVVCDETNSISHSVEIIDGNLVIKKNDNRKWYEHIGIFLSNSEIDIYLTKSEYQSLSIENKTGNVKVSKDFIFDDINILCSTGNVVFNANVRNTIKVKVSTGNMEFRNLTCKNISLEGKTGNVYLENVIATGEMDVKISTGNIKLNDSDALNMTLKTNTGNIKGTILTAKIFIAKTSTGNIDVPKTITGGICNVTTSTGNISLKIS